MSYPAIPSFLCSFLFISVNVCEYVCVYKRYSKKSEMKPSTHRKKQTNFIANQNYHRILPHFVYKYQPIPLWISCVCWRRFECWYWSWSLYLFWCCYEKMQTVIEFHTKRTCIKSYCSHFNCTCKHIDIVKWFKFKQCFHTYKSTLHIKTPFVRIHTHISLNI